MNLLIVDDNATNLKLLRAVLEAEGVTVCEAADGREALAVLEAHPVDAIVSDILMPNMDGYRLCYEVRRHARFQHLPFVFYTSTYTSFGDEKLAREMGGDAFISKPAGADRILAVLREILSRPRPQPQAAADPAAPREAEVMKHYSEQLVTKLEHQHARLQERTAELEREIVDRKRAQEQAQHNLDLAERSRRAVLSAMEDQMQTEAALRESETRLRLSVEAANVGLWDWDLKTNRVFYSREWKRQIGYRDDEISNDFSEWQSRVHPDDLGPMLQKVSAFVAHPQGRHETEFRFRHKDGSYRWIYTHADVVRDADGKPARMLGCHLDITARKEAEAAVQASERQLRSILDTMFVFVGLMNLDGQVVEVNHAPLEAAGLTREDVLGRIVAETYWFSHAPDVQEQVRRALARAAQGEIVRDDYSIRVAGDRRVTIDATFAPLRDAAGRVMQIVGSAVDITERKQAEQKLEESRAQLRALLARLQRAREEERIRVSREIHDELGQLLTGLKMDVRWLERKLSEPGLPPALNPLLDRVVGTSELADATIATVQKIAAELRPGTLDKLGLEAALAHEARRFQERCGVPCTVAVAESWPVPSPEIANELFYICQEALTNVARHAHATKVEIRLTVEGDAVVLEVRDDGAGLAETDLHAPRSLGLIGMRERAVQCGAVLTFERNEPRGTRVRVVVRGDG